jgi:amidase
VLRYASGFNPDVDRVFEHALQVLRTAGARLVDIETFPNTTPIGKLEHVILLTELKIDLNRYLETTSPAQAPSRTLADLIAFDQARAAQEMPLFGQEGFIEAQATGGADDPVYLRARSEAREAAGAQGIDRMLQENGVVALIAPTTGPAWLIDPVLRDRSGGGGAGQAAAVAGYPHLTVPMGAVDGLPVGLSFIGPAWSEARLLSFGYAFEQASHARAPPSFRASVVLGPTPPAPATSPPPAGVSASARTP